MSDTTHNEISRNGKKCFYAGFADIEQAKANNRDTTWKMYLATPEGYMRALGDGYTATSVFEFSHPVSNEKGKPQPIRYADIVLDFDATQTVTDDDGRVIGKKGDIESARMALILLVEHLHREYRVSPYSLNYFASGSKGFHVIIPSKLFGGEHGDINLHEIYKGMVKDIILPLYSFEYRQELLNGCRQNIAALNTLLALNNSYLKDDNSYIDDNFFKGGKGQLMRLPNIQRADGKYKVSITYDEILDNRAEYFEELVLSNRTHETAPEKTYLMLVPEFEELFLQHKLIQGREQLVKNKKQSRNAIVGGCEFILFFYNSPTEVDEQRWFLLARILAFAGTMGRELFHAISRFDISRYSPQEAESKFFHASNYGPATCDEIRKKNYCKKDCKIKCPLDLYQRQYAARYDEGRFEVDIDGLHYYPCADDRTNKIRIASYVNVIALARDNTSTSWSKYVEVHDPDNKTHYCTISNADLNGSGEPALAILSDLGVWYDADSKRKSLFLKYLRTVSPEARALLVDKNGWTGNTMKFLPLDFGKQENGDIIHSHMPVLKIPFEQKETLEGWQEHIAKPCEDNFILQIAVMTSLAGPFLKFLDHQGFGLHIYGNSSSGKTTCLKVASSVTGGEVKSWRTTDNALESIAKEHNDNCLLLDEIGQCTPDVVDHTTYMLANGQGKARATKAAVAKQISTWLMTYLSTGELPISEKIKQGYNKNSMAGQEVRCINLLADGGQKQGVFTVVPEQVNPADFANELVKNSAIFKGMALVQVVNLIKKHRKEVEEKIYLYMTEFMIQLGPKLSSQAERVARNFAFLAGVGEFCILFHLLPWKPKAAIHAAQICFEQWVNNNGSDVQYEIRNIADKVLQFVKHGFYTTMYAKNQASSGANNAGKPVYECCHNKKTCIFISNQYLIRERFCRQEQLYELKKYLLSIHLLLLDNKGNIKEQDYHGNKIPRSRGMFIIIDNLYADDLDQKDAISNNNQEKSGTYEATDHILKEVDLNF